MRFLHGPVTLDQIHTTYLILATLLMVIAVGWVLHKIGLIAWLGGVFARSVRAIIRLGFRIWEQTLSWAGWLGLLAIGTGVVAGGSWLIDIGLAVVVVPVAALLLVAGGVTCLAYMYLSAERYEVSRGFKTLYNPDKGQVLATDLLRHGQTLGVPMLASAAVVTVVGFVLLNQAIYESGGQRWYRFADPDADPVFIDFLAYTLVNLLRVVDVFDFAQSYRFLSVSLVRATGPITPLLLMAFKSFFTLLLLQQLFASLRQNRLLAETVGDYWSPHVPIRDRARSVLPQFGPSAITPVLIALRSAEVLTQEQRDQLPLVLAGIGPSAIPGLMRHLHDLHEPTRAITATTLGLLKVRSAIPGLCNLSDDPSQAVRIASVEALGLIGEEYAQQDKRKTGIGLPIKRRGWLFRRFTTEPDQPPRWWQQAGRWVRDPRFRTRSVVVTDDIRELVLTLQTSLNDESTAVRSLAATAVGKIGTQAAPTQATLIKLLQTDTAEVQVQAALALAKISPAEPDVIAALVSALSDPNEGVRVASATALGEFREAAASAVSAIVALLQDRSDEVRAAAAAAVSRIGVKCDESAQSLIEGLTSTDNMVRAQTAESLGRIGSVAETAAPALAEALSDDNDLVRAKAAEALGRIGQAAAPAAVPGLMRLLRDEDNWVRALAAEALGEMGVAAGDAAPALLRSLQHTNPNVRANAAEALGKLRAVHARTVLEEACRDDDVTVRAKAVWAVSIIGPLTPSSQACLLAATTDLSPEVRAIAADSIATHAGDWPNALEALIPLISDGNTDIAVRAMQALHQFQTYSEAAIEAVTQRLNGNQDSRVQSAAALTLSRMGSTAAQSGDELARLALAGDAEVREAAMRALAVLQLPESVGAFVAGLRDDEAEVRKIASAGLLKANQVPDDDVATVIEALRDPETRVRTNAATVIGRMDPIPDQAIPYLIESAVESDDDGLRLAATLALRNADSAVPHDIMRRLLQDKNQRVQLAAAAALLHSDAADALVETIIWTALVDTNWRVREIAIAMLESHPEAVTAYRRDLELWVVKETDPHLRERVERLLTSTSEPPVVELTTAS